MYIWCIPIVSLDKIYLSITRLDGSKELVSRNRTYTFNSVISQIKIISESLLNNGIRDIILADDVVFSGSVLRTVTNLFNQYNVRVVGIRSAISTCSSYQLFNETLPLGIKCGYLMSEQVIDQICERDFYFGIAGSGISIVGNDNKIYKAPYFIPYGNPVARASIPEKNKITFSKNCLARSIILWEEIERLSKRKILIKDLPKVNLN